MGDYGRDVHAPKGQVVGANPLPSHDPNEVSVLITGFGPFKTNLVNASYLIASSLPPSITFPSKPSSSSGGSTHAPRRISLHVHPSPIPVAYSSVRQTVPSILEEHVGTHGRRPDIIIHMGIASTRRHYSVETQAHRDGYHISDVKGRSGYDDGEKLWMRLGLPALLAPGPATEDKAISDAADTQAVSISSSKPRVRPHVPDGPFLAAWKSFCPSDSDVRLSQDAGRYLCEYIFYTSMALALQKGQDRNVVFFHVPALCEDEDVALGKEVTIALVKALVSSWIDQASASAGA